MSNPRLPSPTVHHPRVHPRQGDAAAKLTKEARAKEKVKAKGFGISRRMGLDTEENKRREKEKSKTHLNSDRWARKRGAGLGVDEDEQEDGIVMELCKATTKGTELVTLVQELVRAQKSRPNSRRWEESHLAIQAISHLLALTELFQIFPGHLANLTIVCPPVMRLIPWGALLVEAEGYESSVEAPIIDRYNIRMGPSLAMYELTSMQGSRIKHAIGNFKMCFIDGSVKTPRDIEIEMRGCTTSYRCVESSVCCFPCRPCRTTFSPFTTRVIAPLSNPPPQQGPRPLPGFRQRLR